MFENVKPNSQKWFNLEDLLNEEWKDIKDFEGLYQISNYGRVKSLEKPEIRNQFSHTRIMKTKPNRLGYSTIHFRYGDKEYITIAQGSDTIDKAISGAGTLAFRQWFYKNFTPNLKRC